MLNEKAFSEGMSVLCAVYEREITKTLLKAYYMVLGGLTEAQFSKAVEEVLSSRQYNSMPTPAAIKEVVYGNREDAALIALDKMETAFKTVGAYRSVQFDDPIIHAVIEHFGGWPKLCSLEHDEWKFVRKDFAKAYAAFAAKPESLLRLPEKCAGIVDTANAANGYEVPEEIALIGNKLKELGGNYGQRILGSSHQKGQGMGTQTREERTPALPRRR